MKKIFITLLLAAVGFTVNAASSSSQYAINDQAIEQVFTNCVAMTSQSDMPGNAENAYLASGLSTTDATAVAKINNDKSFAVALVLDFFLGTLGIHRLYLGTRTITWVGYILTCGGIFGIVPLVDFVVLILNNEDISQYVDNPRFFMWTN